MVKFHSCLFLFWYCQAEQSLSWTGLDWDALKHLTMRAARLFPFYRQYIPPEPTKFLRKTFLWLCKVVCLVHIFV
jgi:hypothetical protein